MDTIKLFHGTSAANGQSISINGLLPRQDGGNWIYVGQVPSLKNMIYFSNSLIAAEFHGLRTALIKGEKFYSIISADVATANLYPDENYFIDISEGDRGITALEMLEAQNKLLAAHDKWTESLETRKLVSHLGPVDRSNVSIFCTRPLKENLYASMIEHEESIEEFNWCFSIITSIPQPKDISTMRFERDSEGNYSYRDSTQFYYINGNRDEFVKNMKNATQA